VIIGFPLLRESANDSAFRRLGGSLRVEVQGQTDLHR
jgi:hypothetical protein